MSERGVFAVDRGIWGHPSFANEKLTEREAWMWLIGNAAFKAHTRRIGSAEVQLVRGQAAASGRFMAEKWGWSEPRVRRFLKRLKADAMIDAATDAGITVITICNYNKYQRVSLPSDAARDALNDAPATHQRRKLEDKEGKEDISVPNGTAVRTYADSRQELWGEGTLILVGLGVAESRARKMIGSWLKTKFDAQVVLDAIRRARDHCASKPISWITNALKGTVNERIGLIYPDRVSNRSGSTAVLAAVATAAERRAEERSAAGQQRQASRNADSSEKPDSELLGEAGCSRVH